MKVDWPYSEIGQKTANGQLLFCTLMIHMYNNCIVYISCVVPSTPPRNVMVSNVTDDDDIAIVITWDPPSDPNGIIQYYRVEYQQISDPLDNDGRGKRNADLNDTVMNVFANITTGSFGAPTTVTLNGLGQFIMLNH